MRRLALLFTLALSGTLPAAEQLPESAPLDDEDPAAMAHRFAAPQLDRHAMQNLYLESPIQIRDPEQEGMGSVAKDQRYSETDLLFRERLQGQYSAIREPAPSIEREAPQPSPPVPVNPL